MDKTMEPMVLAIKKFPYLIDVGIWCDTIKKLINNKNEKDYES